jgi:serine/threonine protein kinase
LKPENILCGENLEDLKIADFGLSKMILPKEKMDAACGTLSYVAPEVSTYYDNVLADKWHAHNPGPFTF